MSSKELADMIQGLEKDRLIFSVQYAGLALIYYDYLLTLPDEIRYVWRSHWRLSTLFYIFCRYALVANLLYYFSISKEPQILDCTTGYIISGTLSLLGHVGIIAVWGLRTYTIWNKNKYVAGILGLSGGLTIVLLAIRAPFNRCTGPVQLRWIRGVIAASMIFFDVTAFALATYRTVKTILQNKKNGLKIKGFSNQILFSQGLLYMAPVFVLSCVSLTLNFQVKWFFSRMMNAFKLPLSGLLTARFMLKLRKWNKTQNRNNEPCCSLPALPQFIVSTGNEPAMSSTYARASVSKSNLSILDELGGDIGPRSSLGETSIRDDIESECDCQIELENLSRSDSVKGKGKYREQDGEHSPSLDEPEVITRSARRQTFVDVESGTSGASLSQCRGRTRAPTI